MKIKKTWKRSLAWILSAAMIFGMSGVPAFADGTDTMICPHHVHDESCGYAEGTPCTHQHTEDCYTEATNCIHQHTAECYSDGVLPAEGEVKTADACTHVCSEESGCITKTLNCQHVHDENCGYTAGSPCTFDPADCELCNSQNEGIQEQCSCITLCTEGDMNPDCPVCGAKDADPSVCKGAISVLSVQTISSWLWSGNGVENLKDGALLLPDVSETNPIDFDTIVSKLPTTVQANVGGLGYSLLTIQSWQSKDFVKDAGGNYPTSGTYTFTAVLPDGYELAADAKPLDVSVQLGKSQTMRVVEVDVSSTETDNDDYKILSDYIQLKKRDVIYHLTGSTNKPINLWGSNDSADIDESFYLRLDNVTVSGGILTVNSPTSINLEALSGTTNTFGKIQANRITMSGSGTVNATLLTVQAKNTTYMSSALHITDTKLVVKNEGGGSSWEGTITLDGSADVTITGNDKYVPLSIGGGDSSQQAVVTLEDHASLKCLQKNMNTAYEYIVDGLSMSSGKVSLLLKDNSYLEVEGKKSSSLYGQGYGIVADGCNITIQDEATLKSTAYGAGVWCENLKITGGNIDIISYNSVAIETNADCEISGGTLNLEAQSSNPIYTAGGNITIAGTAEIKAEGYYPIMGSNIRISDSAVVNAVSTGDCGIYATEGITITGGTVTAVGGSNYRGIAAEGDIIVAPPAGQQITVKAGSDAAGAIEIEGSPFTEEKEISDLVAKTYFHSEISEASSPVEPEDPDTGLSDGSGSTTTDNSTGRPSNEEESTTTSSGSATTQPTTPTLSAPELNGQLKAGEEDIVATVEGSSTKLDAIVEEGVFSKLTAQKSESLTVNTEEGLAVSLDADSISELKELGGDIRVRFYKTSVSNESVQQVLDGHPVYKLSLSVDNGSSVKTISTLKHPIGISVPYTLKKGETAGSLMAVRIVGDKVEWMINSSYDTQNGQMIFSAEQPGTYAIVVKEVPVYTDIENHWAKDAIEFAAARGLLTGTDGKFNPDSAATEGDLIHVLAILNGVTTDATTWAQQKNIVGSDFDPAKVLTNQQLAMLLEVYCDKMNIKLSKTLDEITFADTAAISESAKDEVRTMQQAGVMYGSKDNTFAPDSQVTRAQLASVLQNFVEVQIFPQSANGWQHNDVGEIYYFAEGKRAAGWKKVDGKWYYFYEDGAMAVSAKVGGYEVGADGARK